MSLAEQIGNIGSEISRARHWEEVGEANSRENALGRALELIDLTLSDSRWQRRLKELSRLRELISDSVVNLKIYHFSLVDLERFCLNFATVIRK